MKTPLESAGHRPRPCRQSSPPFFWLCPSGRRIPARRKADRTHCLRAAAGEPPCETRLSLDPIRLSQVTLSSLPSLAFFIFVYAAAARDLDGTFGLRGDRLRDRTQ